MTTAQSLLLRAKRHEYAKIERSDSDLRRFTRMARGGHFPEARDPGS